MVTFTEELIECAAGDEDLIKRYVEPVGGGKTEEVVYRLTPEDAKRAIESYMTTSEFALIKAHGDREEE